MNDFFPHWRPALPWSIDTIGVPALVIVATLLVLFTIWTYFGHPQATRKRLFILVALRLAALIVALITAVRPSVGENQNTKVPSVLLIGVDTSRSMTVNDELGNRPREEAVRKMLEKCQPVLDELQNDHNVSVIQYSFSTSDFNEAINHYTSQTPSNGDRSDYGTLLNRLYDRWQGERYLRALILIGDGQDNGETYTPATEGAKFGRRGTPIHTFVVGQSSSSNNKQDIVVTSIECDPSPAPIKTTVNVKARVNAYGFGGAQVVARVYFDDKPVERMEFTLEEGKGRDGRGNELKIPVKAPDTKGEIKVKVEVGLDKDGKIVALPGELSPLNNWSETYLTITKDGVRILIVDQLRPEETRIRDALRTEKRFDLYEVTRQRDLPANASERELLDLDRQAYDVIIIGNLSAEHVNIGSNTFLPKLADQIKKKGTGVMFLGGEFAFKGYPDTILPIETGPIIDNLTPTGTPITWYPTIPTARGLEKMFKLGPKPEETKDKWDRLNRFRTGRRISGYNQLILPKGGLYTVYAWTTNVNDPNLIEAGSEPQGDALLVGSQRGDASKARWLAFGAYDTFLWEPFGRPKSPEATEWHHRFWRQCVLWLAHQDEEESQVFARPQFRQLKVTAEQTIRVGMKLPNGDIDQNAQLFVRILPLAPGQQEPKPNDEKNAPLQTILTDKDSALEGRKVVFRPTQPGEYFVVAESPMKGPDGQPVMENGQPKMHRGTAKFIVVPDVSDEMLQVNANPDFMARLSLATSGKAMKLDELPGFLNDFLKEVKDPKNTLGAKKPRYYPDWNRNRSRGFLPLWLVVFVALLGTEWGLRRLWGMI
ncbi:MAG: VWA domain-containing protein [Planctomycetia bacterium]|nr:VWA domain-containing protein [Planctomycetia bacterium]